MALPPAVKQMPSAHELLEYSFDRLDKFGLPEIDFVLPKWILNSVTMNRDANPGLYSRLKLGNTKESAYSKAILVARKLWDRIVTSRSPVCDTSLWSVGGRARKQDFSKGKPPESRVVLMPEIPNSIIAGAIAQPMVKALKKSMAINPSCECFMGQDTTNGGWRRIRDFTTPGTPVLELDWARFDVSVIENAMVAAFCIIRSCFPESAKVDKLFLFVMSGFIYKNIAIKQRFIYRITRGVPSGSPLTSIVDTLVNWVCLNYTLRKHKLFGIDGPDDYKLAVAGDDTLIAFKNGDKHKLEYGTHVSRTFREAVNLNVDPDDLNYNYWYGGENYLPDGSDPEYAPSLLKTTIWKGIPGRRLEDLEKSISCPESKVRSYWDLLEVIKGYTSIPVFTPLGRAFLKSVSQYIGQKIALQKGLSPDSEMYHAFSGSTYLPICESLVRFDDISEAMLKDPPYMKKEKWKGEPARGWAAGLAERINLAYFGIP
uniref:RNA-dependent RNA polymerase n=1 Tax=Shrew durnavirus 1 TaxID=3139611 RepID=A0AB38ZJM9_9VIRU